MVPGRSIDAGEFRLRSGEFAQLFIFSRLWM